MPDIEVGRTGAGPGPVHDAGQQAEPPEQIEELEVAVNEAGSGLRRLLPQDAEGGFQTAGRVAEAGITGVPALVGIRLRSSASSHSW